MSVRETTVPGYFSTHLVPADVSGAAKRLAARAIGFGGGASDNNKGDPEHAGNHDADLGHDSPR